MPGWSSSAASARPGNHGWKRPRQGRLDGPVCRLEIFEPWVPAIKGVDFYESLEVIYWLHQSRRDLVLQSPKNNQKTRGTFFAALAGAAQPDRHLDREVRQDRGQRDPGARPRLSFDETPLLDIKPDRCEFTPLAPPQPGDFRKETVL